jgi:WD40 repeat protein
VAAGSSDGYVYLWGPGNSPPIPLGGVFQAAVESVAFSPDGRLLAAGDGDGNFALAQVRVVGNQVRPQPLSPAGGQLNPVDAVAFSPDGRVLATGSADGTVELWDISDASRRVRLATLTGLTQAVTSLAFSPGTSPGGGAELAVSADDGTIHLWDVSHPAAPVALATLTGLGNPTAISWEDDGLASRTVIGAAPDGTVVSWDTKPRAIAARICASPLAGSGSDLGPYLGGSIAYRAICPPG